MTDRPESDGRRCPPATAPRRRWFVAAGPAAVRPPVRGRRSCRPRPDRAGCRAESRRAPRRRGGRTWPVGRPATPATRGGWTLGPGRPIAGQSVAGPRPAGPASCRARIGRSSRRPIPSRGRAIGHSRRPRAARPIRRRRRGGHSARPVPAARPASPPARADRARCNTAPVRVAGATRRTRLVPSAPIHSMPSALGSSRAANRLQFRQRRGELDGGNQPQLLAVEQPQQHLQHVLADGVLGRGEERAGIVTRRGLQAACWDRSCCRRPTRRASARCSRRG